MHLYQILEIAAEQYPNNTAVICGNIQYNYSELKNRVDILANNLRELGITKDTKLAIIHKNCHSYLETYFAAAKLGAVLVPVNFRLAPDDFVYIINNSKAKILISEPEFITPILRKRDEFPSIEKIILTRDNSDILVHLNYIKYDSLLVPLPEEKLSTSEIRSDDIAHIYYTSGTTGQPKGVILTHRNNYVHAEWTIKELNLTQNDVWLHVSPLFHLADAWAVWTLTKVGATHVIVPGFEPTEVLEAIGSHKVTLTNFIPTMLNILVSCSGTKYFDCSSLRLIMSGGAPIAPEVVRKILDVFGCDYIQTYGLTETSPFLTMSILKDQLKMLPFEDRFKYMTTTGRPFAKVQLKVVNEMDIEVEKDDHDVGEIIVKGETITPGYWELPEVTSQRIKDGWLHTRDLATINSEGYVTIVDRIDDMIITGGENVFSIEVENVLYSHPDIIEACVVGLPHEIWGEMVAAIVMVQKDTNIKEDDIIDFCKKNLAHFKAPKKVFFVNELPKTGSGKIFKYKLRKQFCSGN
jgi:acyl-CoA synthetase (AMP-forming)/AMP-acid ligase II